MENNIDKLNRVLQAKRDIILSLRREGITDAEIDNKLENLPDLVSKAGSQNFPDWFNKALVCWYDPRRQGLTNEQIKAENAANGHFLLRDFSRNKLDMKMYNFAGEGMSGMDGYPINICSYASINCDIQKSENKITISNIVSPGANIAYTYYPKQNRPGFKCRITFHNDLPDNQIQYIYITKEGYAKNIFYKKSGIYDIPESYSNVDQTIGFYATEKVKSPITIEVLPEYEGTLVFDGTDDWGKVVDDKLKLNDYTVISNRIHFYGSEYLTGKSTNYTIDGAFIFDHSRGFSWSYGGYKKFPVQERFSWQTKNKHNGENLETKGLPDTNILLLGQSSEDAIDVLFKGAFYNFLLFNRTLTPDELLWVRSNCMNEYNAGQTNTDEAILNKILGYGNK